MRIYENFFFLSGLTVTRAGSLLKDPDEFSSALLRWAEEKGVQIREEEIAAFLEAKLTPEKVRGGKQQ